MRKKDNIMKKIISIFAFTTCLSSNAIAAGFYIQEQSVSGLGASFAGQTAMARDASIIYFNPAGMTYLEGSQGNIGVHIIAPHSDIDDTGTSNAGLGLPTGQDSKNPYDPAAVPNLHYSHQLNNKWWAGLSVTAPFGLGSEYDGGWFGRYDALKSELKTFNVQPSIAYKVSDKLSIGGGIDIQYVDAILTKNAFVTTQGLSTLSGDDISYGYNFGFIYEPSMKTKLGLHYRSQINHKLDGRIVAEGTGGGDINTDGYANLNLPDIVSFSVAQDIDDQWTIMGGASWFGWDNFQQIRAYTDSGVGASNVIQNYKNSMAFNIGAEYKYSPEWTFRGGVQYDQTPTQDGFRSTSTPDGDRIWLSGGTTYSINDKMSLDFALTYIDIAKENISLTRNAASNIRAKSNGYVGIAALGLNYKF